MAIDRERHRLLVAFRNPPGLGVLAPADGKSIATVDTCGDVDDLFVDAGRKRVYVSCGQGYVDVLEANGMAYHRISRIPTVAGARTSLFVPEMDRLIVAARESFAERRSGYSGRYLEETDSREFGMASAAIA
ncbi:hypothetical protein [Bradyrhizobium iriomotense]|nr:hypothetical protein [Bradyrhizobium iriomotense]